ncbi:hypothetical protein DL546_007604 [Coniochaeta pulveracea]|uniref:Uncharacterized protein n=1 Tax=Coniochaeta pulveracea TaxID=177199 RepID=A0A420YIU3_9PEZI|nr:hypothetical protein DL546_007604 [Coniochaeta pulveracea]
MDLDNISFEPSNMYASRPHLRTAYKTAVANWAGRPSNAVYAVIVNGPHTSISDRRKHITVDYKDENNAFITRSHVPHA